MTDQVRLQATIVTSDWQGSTALGERLDPESLRDVQSTYFDAMRAVFESHGGIIEKVIGDAIVAVFGLTTARDDDALRAVEAAAESQRALGLLNDRLEARWGVRLIVRTGVATGEVVVGEATAGQHVLTGRTVGVATAMEQNAPPLEVLLSASTYEAVRDAVKVAPIGVVQAKGSDEPLQAYRLLSVAERPDVERFPIPVDETGSRPVVGETRKTVTIVFADPKPTTTNGAPPEPEVLRDVMSSYFSAMNLALQRHGATVEKFIGDAVMAVFGLPIRHEDDALRAVRAAMDMQQVLPELNAAFEAEWGITLQNRIGVNTGEVVAGDASLGQRLVTGDTVNVAARLEQAAGPREILLGSLTHRLVRDAVRVEEVEPLTLKGKAERVPAYRLIGLSEESIKRRHDSPMIGRDAEMGALAALFEHALADRVCRMATVVGDAGVGKSRLIGEFTAASASDALVIRGRCLSYGEGITFWPLREAARDAAGIGNDDPPAIAMDKLRTRVGDDAVAERLASVIGLSQSPFPVPEVFWGARKFLEGLSRERPVLLVIEDIHWAEVTFLELIGHLVEAVEASPVLLLCTSRHDLLEEHPAWATDEGSLRLVLRPLTDVDATQVVAGLLGGTGIAEDVSGRIVEAAAGNPLFVEQLLSMLIDNGTLRNDGGRWEQIGDVTHLDVPPSIQALLAARLDLLQGYERNVIEPASVIGQVFAQEAVAVLAPEAIGPQVGEHLAALTRKELVQPNPGSGSDEVAYRFQHLLVREAAYDGLLKRARAQLHERFVNWAEDFNARLGLDNREFEEIHGYHLEQAYRYLKELGTLDDHAGAVGIRASTKLAAAGRRAMTRGDMPAAANLLRRAAETRPTDDLDRYRLLPDLGEALTELGEFEEASSLLTEAREGAERAGDIALAESAGLVRLLTQMYSGEEAWSDAVLEAVDRAVEVFERVQDHAGLALANRLRVAVRGTANRFAQATAAAEEVIQHAQRASDVRLERRGAVAYAQTAVYGPTPVAEALGRLDELAGAAEGDRRTVALIRGSLAQLLAMEGDFERARSTFTDVRGMLEDLKNPLLAASNSTIIGQIELLAGQPEAALKELEADYKSLGAMGEKYLLATVAGMLAEAAYQAGRLDEAETYSDAGASLSSPDDIDAQVRWRAVRARVLAHRAKGSEGLAIAEEALALANQTDALILQSLALTALAEVQDLLGNTDRAIETLRAALAVQQSKGDVVSAARTSELLNAKMPGH